jgi:hypothetical protein
VFTLAFSCGEIIRLDPAQAVAYTAVQLFNVDGEGQIGGVVLGQYAAGGEVVGSFKNAPHAFLQSSAGDPIDLNPSGFANSEINDTDGTQQIGDANPGNGSHAILWSGSAGSAVDLNPTNITFSSTIGDGIGGGQEVGWGNLPGNSKVVHALLWNASSTVVTDLNPTSPGITWSVAQGTDGINQVGWAVVNGLTHAFLWSGTAGSAIDLNPTTLAGITESGANAVSGDEEVGRGLGSGFQHALLWTGSAGSVVDLNPAGYAGSEALGTNGLEQVGDGGVPFGDATALLWSGTAASAINLGALLTVPYAFSTAYSINAQGDVFGIATNGGNAPEEAIEWIPSTPVPEPSVLALIGLGASGLLRRRRL